MKTLIFGCGNLLFSDEGFGVHAIRYLEANYLFPPEVELFDAGTLGIMAIHKIEEAERVYVLDVVDTAGAPGELRRYDKTEIMLNQLPVKLSPHQIGIQEVLTLAELRETCPEAVTILGVIPQSLDTGCTLTPPLAAALVTMAEQLVAELAADGMEIVARAA